MSAPGLELDDRSGVDPRVRRGISVCHFTSVHPYDDVRIFQKECRSLAAEGFDVHLVAVGGPDATIDGVHVHGVAPAWRSRLGRMARAPWSVAAAVSRIDADIYHFHDPELLPVGLWLRSKGKRVVYDAHEDLPRDLASKRYLGWFRYPMRWPVESVEDFASRRFSAIVTATPFIGKRFSRINSRTVVVNNFPIRDQFLAADALPWTQREATVSHIGVVSAHRGLFQMIEAVEIVAARLEVGLLLVGRVAPSARERAMAMPGWRHVRELGQVSRAEVASVLGKTRAGLVIFQPEPNHVNSQPNKLFEYMSAGLPVIASDFPLWKELFTATGCGLLVDPRDPADLAAAIEFVLTRPEEAEAMGRRGREAVVAWCNWETESKKLVKLYDALCKSSGVSSDACTEIL